MKIDYKIPVTLGIVCLISTLLLSLTYVITEPKIKSVGSAELKSQLKNIISADNYFLLSEEFPELYSKLISSPAVEDIYLARTDNKNAGLIFVVKANGYGGEIKFLVGYNSGTITNLTVLSHSETPGLGARISEKGFLSQFIGSNVAITNQNKLAYTTITGATISSSAVIGTLSKVTDSLLSGLTEKEKSSLGIA